MRTDSWRWIYNLARYSRHLWIDLAMHLADHLHGAGAYMVDGADYEF
jgi:hypothetical protein